MRRAVLRAMLISLRRDPAALAMSFALPAAVFLIFAIIFSGASGGSLNVRLAVLDLERSGASKRLIDGVKGNPQMIVVQASEPTEHAIVELVRSGAADVGMIVRGGQRTLNSADQTGDPPIVLVTDPTRDIAVAVVEGIVQESYFSKLPDVVVKGIAHIITSRLVELNPAQAARLEAGIDAISQRLERNDAGDVGSAAGISLPFQRLMQRKSAIGDPSVPSSIPYYAAAVAIMFLLFASLNGALTLLQEKESGLLERLSTGPSGVRAVIDGKFCFLWLQGVVQVTVIFLAAWLGFGLDLPRNLSPWLAISVAASAAASGLMLGFVSLCRTVQQAQTLGTIIVLIASAIGGSMIPRFLMPQYIQTMGWLTPNTWVLEAYGAIFLRNETWQATLLPIAALAVSGLAGLLVAHLAMSRQT